MTKKLILVGGGGHCKACISVIETTEFTIAGIVDKGAKTAKVLDFPVVGDDSALNELIKKKYLFLVTVGQIKTAVLRAELFDKIKKNNGEMAVVKASSSIVSKYSTLGEGTIVMHQAIVNASVKIGNNCIINNLSLIEHDCTIGDHSHISTGAIVNGGCAIGNGVFVGSNSVIANDVHVTDDVVIGAGSIVIKNISAPGIYAGNPAVKINK
jgi:sugar O-acyltransferase (sialic acid O-acetyltransferase NeuD family)